MPSLWPPSGRVPNWAMTRPLTGQRKLLPDIGSGAGNCSTLARRGLPWPVISGDAATSSVPLDGFLAAGLAPPSASVSSASDVAPGGRMVVVLTTRAAVSPWADGVAGLLGAAGSGSSAATFGAGAGLALLAAVLAEAPGITISCPIPRRPSGRLLAAWMASTETP